MKKLFLICLSLFALTASLNAKVTKDYQRPSLHLVLLNTEETTSQYVDPSLLNVVSDSWQKYVLPVQYNQWTIDLKEADGGKPKGGIMALISKYPDPSAFMSLTKEQLEDIQSLSKGKQYIEDLKVKCDEVAPTVARQFVEKWFNIHPEVRKVVVGTDTTEVTVCAFALDTLYKYACYSATQSASNEAVETSEASYAELLDELYNASISSTYVDFAKVSLYANEPIELFNKNLALAIIDMTAQIAMQQGGPAAMAAQVAQTSARAIAEKAYEKTKEGYRIQTTSLLYRLKWNKELSDQINSIMTYEVENYSGVIDYEKFLQIPFALEYVGDDQCHTITRLNKDTKEMNDAQMVDNCLVKNMNKQLVNLQNENEEFRPMMPILFADKKTIIADLGTKEGVEENDQFVVLKGETGKNGIVKYVPLGTVKVQKKGVWDNMDVDNYQVASINKALGNQDTQDIQGTKLTSLPGVDNSMFVKQKNASKPSKK